MNLVDELHAITAALTAAGIRYAVCGGVAVTLHGATRSTKDIDLLVSPDDVQRTLEVVRPLGYVFAALPMTFDEGTERERHVQRVSKIEGSEHLLLDLLVADAAFEGALDDRVEVQLPSGPMAVVSRAVLVRMKRLAGRAQDLADLEKLEEHHE
jgi:putative nucleotidyltransferase-like protein